MIISDSKEIFVINKKIDTKITNKFYTFITPYCDSNVGIIFGLDNLIEITKYYIFQINGKGKLTLLMKENGVYKNLIFKKNKFIKNYNKNNMYKMSILFNPDKGNIVTSINDKIVYSIIDKTFKGTMVGLFSRGKNTVFSQILSEEF